MNKYPLKTVSKKAPLRQVEPADVDVVRPPVQSGGFFSFSYSYTEVTSQGGRTHVKSRRAQLADGKLSTESFEGETAGHVYDDMVRQAQQQVLDPSAWLLRSLSWLLPVRRTRPDRE